MKNIVLFIVDSMNYSHMKDHPELTPYINELKEKSLYFDSMYSQAPYTEAAVMNIYCGQNVLDRGGYLYRFRDAKKTIFEAMKEKGYITYFNAFQPQCYAHTLRRGIDYLYNNVGYDVGPLWSYRFYLYADSYNKGRLSEDDYRIVCDILEENLDEWMLFERLLIEKDDSLNMIQTNTLSYNPETILAVLSEEKLKFEADKKGYINSLFEQKRNHILFKLSSYNQDNKIKGKSFIPGVQKLAGPTFKRINMLQKRLNRKVLFKATRGPFRQFGQFIKHPGFSTLKDFAKSALGFLNVVKDEDLFDRIADNYETFKNAPSVKTHIDHYINWEKNRNKPEPSFACIHVDDIHNPEIFFTYDSEDEELIKRELQEANEVMDLLQKTYYGNVTHDLSLRYIDSKIRYFFEQLKVNNLLDDTIVLICADHGFSFAGNPLRDSFVTNMYLENYNIPCIIWGSEVRGARNELCTSKDIASVICYLADKSIPEEFNGRNIVLEKSPYDKVFIEYCGGGCPDLSRRKLKIACFDKKYFVATEELLAKELTLDDVTEIYNLEKDPKQMKNLAKKRFDRNLILPYLEEINKRRERIRKEK